MSAKTGGSCPKGHPWTPENTYHYRNIGYCRECRRQYHVARWERVRRQRSAANDTLFVDRLAAALVATGFAEWFNGYESAPEMAQLIAAAMKSEPVREAV